MIIMKQRKREDKTGNFPVIPEKDINSGVPFFKRWKQKRQLIVGGSSSILPFLDLSLFKISTGLW